MSGRNLSAAMQAEHAKSTVHPVFFVKSEFNDGDVFLWSGRGVISWNGETWTGSGKLMSISGFTPFEEEMLMMREDIKEIKATLKEKDE